MLQKRIDGRRFVCAEVRLTRQALQLGDDWCLGVWLNQLDFQLARILSQGRC